MSGTISGDVKLNVTQFNKAIAEMRRSLRVVESGWKASAAALGDWAKDVSGIETRLAALNQKIPLHEKEVAALKERYDQLAAEQGAESSAAQNMAVKLNYATKRLNAAKSEASALTDKLSDMRQEEAESGDASATLKSKMSKLVSGLKRLAGMTETAVKGIKKLSAGAKAAAKAVGNTAKRIASATAAAAKTIVSTTAKLVGGLLIGLGALAAATVGPASDLNETISKTQVVFGEAAKDVLAFGKSSAAALGMSQNAALGAAATYGNLLRATGLSEQASAEMSTGLVQLAADLASFNNIEPDVALEKLRAGLTGEAEPLKVLGINMNQARLKAKALELGLIAQGEELNAAAKAQAAYAIMLEDSALAQGDFARTSDGLANQSRILNSNLDNLRATIGTALLPIITAAKSKVNGWFAAFEDSGGLTTLTDNLGHLGAAITGLLNGTVGLATVGALIGNLFGGLGDSLGEFDLGAVLGKMLSGIGGMAAKLNLGGLALDIIGGLVDSISDGLPGLLTAAQGIIEKLVSFLSQGIPTLITAALPLLLALGQGILAALPVLITSASEILNTLLTALIAAAPVLIPAALNAVFLLAETLISNLPAIVDAGMSVLMSLITGITAMLPDLIPVAVEAILSVVTTLLDNLPLILDAGISILVSLISGITSMLPDLIPVAVAALVSVVQTLIANLPLVIDAALQLILALANGIILALPILIAAAPEIIVSLLDTILAMLPQIAEAAGELISTLVMGIIASIPGVIDAALQIITAVVDFFASGDVIDVLVGIGKGIVDGIWKGIKNAQDWFLNQITDFFGGLVDTVKSALGIGSPSRLFADEIGKNIPPGIGEGIKAAMPKLRRELNAAMAGLAALQMPGIGGTAAAASAGPTYQITVPLTVYGADGGLLSGSVESGVLAGLRAAGIR